MRRAIPGRRPIAVAALLIAAAPTAPVRAADVRCDYTRKIDCTASGCAVSPVSGAHLRLADAATLLAATQRAADASSLPIIQICDGAACSPIRVRAARGGAFLNIAQDGGAHFVKMAMMDVPPGIRAGDFLEVAARFLTTSTYVGSCPAVVLPATGR
jgi:hypothetical protein